MASLQLPKCKKKSAAHKNGFEVLVRLIGSVKVDKFDLMFKLFCILTILTVVTSHNVVLEPGRHPLRAALTRGLEAGQTPPDRDSGPGPSKRWSQTTESASQLQTAKQEGGIYFWSWYHLRGLELQMKVGEDFTIMEKASSRAFSWLKVPTSTFTF